MGPERNRVTESTEAGLLNRSAIVER